MAPQFMARLRLTLIFFVVLIPPAVTLVWLGIRLVEQDRVLQTQREIEGRETSAEAITRSLTQSIAEQQPVVLRAMQEAPDAPFINGEKAEFQGTLESAAHLYEEIQQTSDRSVRAGALLRIARVEQHRSRIDESLHAYRALALINDVTVDGTPADFIARRRICGLLAEAGRKDELRIEVQLLEKDFLEGRWIVPMGVWEIAAEEIAAWAGHAIPASAERRALAAGAAGWFSEISRNEDHAPSGSRSLIVEGTPLTVIWRTEGAQLKAIMLSSSVLDKFLAKALSTNSERLGRVTLLTETGDTFIGERPDSTAHLVRRTSLETGLPWTLVLSPSKASLNAADVPGRRRVFAAGLAAIVLFLAGGSYFLWRVMERELAVARLQTEFVAAVSHEFRTPLTSLRHVTELLEEDDGLPPGPEQERRKTFYAALSRNTERLHRLVESLLDFSRMETGKKPWNLQSTDVSMLVADVASEFQKDVKNQGVRIDFTAEQGESFRLRADGPALGHALWNLLDNAVKYSLGRGTVHVSVGHHSRGIAISVRDEGIGVPARERREIFRKFVRGQKASELGIQGTGLGLALVSHIVEAHGGEIEVESEEGKGSTFRLVLPAQV
jgi:signal transduction histidine kinase